MVTRLTWSSWDHLVLVGPVAVLAGLLVLREHRAGPVVALGPAAYALYICPQPISAGPGRHPGNAEQFFPLFLVLFVLAGGSLCVPGR